jgi:hypothetical protein
MREAALADGGRGIDHSSALELVQVPATPRSIASELIAIEYEVDGSVDGTRRRRVCTAGRD